MRSCFGAKQSEALYNGLTPLDLSLSRLCRGLWAGGWQGGKDLVQELCSLEKRKKKIWENEIENLLQNFRRICLEWTAQSGGNRFVYVVHLIYLGLDESNFCLLKTFTSCQNFFMQSNFTLCNSIPSPTTKFQAQVCVPLLFHRITRVLKFAFWASEDQDMVLINLREMQTNRRKQSTLVLFIINSIRKEWML